MEAKWSKVSLSFFFIVAIIGSLLRAVSFISIPLEYSHLVHAHSHVAFQGWIYTIMMLLLCHLYLKKQQITKGRYLLQFKLAALVIVGVLISFAIQGYGLYSIIFSTLFQFFNYWFMYRFVKDATDNKTSLKFVKTGLFFGVLSTIMPYIIGILSAKGYAGTEIYQSCVYTFMHIQYNGWFLFVVIGLFFKFLEKNAFPFKQRYAQYFYWSFTIALIPSISLSLLGMSFSKYFIAFAYFAAILQLLGMIFFILSIKRKIIDFLKSKSKWIQLFITLFLLSFLIKTITQSLSIVPTFQTLAFQNKFIILAYLHLSLIGAISFLLLGMMIEVKWIIISHFSKIGISFFILGFFITEILLTIGGLQIYYNQAFILLGSFFMAIGLLFLILTRTYSFDN